MSSENHAITIKCKKCRTILSTSSLEHLVNAHNEQYSNESDATSNCPSVYGRAEVFLTEDGVGSWIKVEIEKSEWTKGKLKCSKCQSNIGSFDFVACQKCECRRFNQPQVHFIKSKVDVIAQTAAAV